MAAEIVEFPVVAGGVQTRVLEVGEGDRALLFVHGLGARADRWRRNMPVLAAQGWRCIALDLPGHGLATKGPGIPATVQALADFTGAVADELQLRDVVLVGTSLGGHILGRLALDRADALAHGGLRPMGLMMIGTLGLFPLDPAVAAAIRRSVTETSMEAIARKVAFVMKVRDGITPAWLREEYLINNSKGTHESLERLGDYLVRQPPADIVGPSLQALSQSLPIAVVWGADDQAVPVQIGWDAHHRLGLPAPTLIEGTGHAPYWERDEVFNPLLATFASRCFGPPAGA